MTTLYTHEAMYADGRRYLEHVTLTYVMTSGRLFIVPYTENCVGLIGRVHPGYNLSELYCRRHIP